MIPMRRQLSLPPESQAARLRIQLREGDHEHLLKQLALQKEEGSSYQVGSSTGMVERLRCMDSFGPSAKETLNFVVWSPA